LLLASYTISFSCVLLFAPATPPLPLPSFPTRRSSDLEVEPRNCPPRPTLTLLSLDLRDRLTFRTRTHRRVEASHVGFDPLGRGLDRKSTRLNSSHVSISYAVFCLKKKKTTAASQSLAN